MVKQLEQAVRGVFGEDPQASDEQLLALFLKSRDAIAFETLVRRHGPMVLSLCQRIIGNRDDAEDAFQATFLVLACRASTVVPQAAVGSWLFGVAYRTSLKLRRVLTRRRTKERTLPIQPGVAESHTCREQEWEAIHQEVHRLPEKYRLPIILCCLEERSRREVARQLGLPVGTLSNRIQSAWEILRKKLTRQGITLAGTVGAMFAGTASASIPVELLRATTTSAITYSAGMRGTMVVSTSVATLVHGELHTMWLTQLKWVLPVSLVALLSGLAFAWNQGAPPAAPTQPAGAAPAKNQVENKPKAFPFFEVARAYVQLNEGKALKIRAELPMGRFIKLNDADGKPVSLHELRFWQAPVFEVELSEVTAFTAKGQLLQEKEWQKKLTQETLVLIDFRDNQISSKSIAETFQVYREDMLVLVMPTSVFLKLDRTAAFQQIKSLPQQFVGGGGSAVPPAK